MVYIKKPKIKDRKKSSKQKGRIYSKKKDYDGDVLLRRYCQIVEEQITLIKSQDQQHRLGYKKILGYKISISTFFLKNLYQILHEFPFLYMEL